MALGGISTTIETGGGRGSPSAASASKNIIAIGVSPDGAINTLGSVNSAGAAKAALCRGSTGGPLAEFVAKLFQHNAPQVWYVPTDVTTHTAQSAITASTANTGSGVPTVADRPHRALRILCSTGGAIATAKFKFSSDGGTTYSAAIPSVDSGGGAFVYRPIGWFSTLTFPGGVYTINETATFPINSGTRVDSVGWGGLAVTCASSVVDDYRPMFEVVTGGAWNSGVVVVKPSLDGGITFLPPIGVGASGVWVIPNSGIEASLAAGTYAAGDSYSWYAAAPTYSTANLQSALNAAMQSASSPQIAMVVCVGLPAAIATAVTEGSTLQTYLATARATYGKQWHLGVTNFGGSSAGDSIGGGTAALSTESDATIRTALLAATETNNVSLFGFTQEMPSSLSGLYLRRPSSWAICARYVETEPRIDPSWVALGALDLYTSADFPLHRDEFTATTALHDARCNVLQSRPGRSGAYLSIEQGGVGWRNMTTDASYQYAAAVRGLAVFLDAVTTRATNYIGQDLATNTDGTIAESAALPIDKELTTVGKRAVGLAKGGAFTVPQASSGSATVDRASNLGVSPRQLTIDYTYQPKGLVSHVGQRVTFSGALTVTE